MKLIVGTVQFGLDYGTVMPRRQNTEKESQDILRMAHSNGIKYLDTAYDYGSSEGLIGKISGSKFKVITKTAHDLSKSDLIIPNLKKSLHKLNSTDAFGLLVHNAENLTGKYSDDVFYNLCKAKDEGLVKNIGVSVYNPEEALYITNRYKIDIIQIPYNILDRRFVGILKQMKDQGIIVHTRSIFLQGILLKDPDALPARLQKVVPYINKIQKTAKDNNISVLQLLMSYVKSTNYELIDGIIIGLHNEKQLQEIISAYNNTSTDIDFLHLATDDINIINPRKWESL